MQNILVAALTGGVLVAIIEGVREFLSWRRNRKAELDDRAEQKAENEKCKEEKKIEQRLESIEEKTNAQSEALKFILYDRIRYLGQAYIAEGEIDFDDRRILNNMHSSYHNGLNGNGDLDDLMAEVHHLPLKTR